MHDNEVDFTEMDEIGLLTYLVEASSLGKNYELALKEQWKRQGVTPPMPIS
jgi:hypothetical protein